MPSRPRTDPRAPAVAQALHSTWQRLHRQHLPDAPAHLRGTCDRAWVRAHGKQQVDLRATGYDDLPSDWKHHNLTAAGELITLLDGMTGPVPADDPRIETTAAIAHMLWLRRSVFARGGPLDARYADLPAYAQEQDRALVIAAARVLGIVPDPAGGPLR